MASLMRISRPIARIKGSAGGPAPMRQFSVSSQTLYAGELVALDANGLVVRAKTAGNNLTGGTDKILGILAHDVDSTKTVCSVILAEANVEFSLPVYHGTAASAVTAVSQIGDKFEARNATGNIPCVDVGTTSNPTFLVQGIDTAYVAGTQYGRVWVSVLQTTYQLAAGV